MFRRIAVEDWQNTLAIISFSIFFAVFMLTLLRIWSMPRKRLEELEHLPLAEDSHEH
jgi:hypothetical protein